MNPYNHNGTATGRSFEESDGGLPSRRGPFLANASRAGVAVFDASSRPAPTLMLERPALCDGPDPALGEQAACRDAEGRDWGLFREEQAVLRARVPDEQAAWTRRLVFETLPDAQDRRWLPAYVQRCPNLVEIVLPDCSDRVVPDLRTHGVRTPDGRWMLRLSQRDDGIGSLDRLCASLRRTLGDAVRRPHVLSAMGRPALFECLARDVDAIRTAAVPDPAFGDGIAAMVCAIVDDDQTALRCALIAREQRTPADRLVAMEAVAAELQRAPLEMPHCPRVEGLAPGSRSQAAVGLLVRMNAAQPRSRWPSGNWHTRSDAALPPTSLDRAERWQVAAFLKLASEPLMTAAMRVMRDGALRLVQADTPFADRAFLSAAEEDVLVDALHLGLLVDCRVIGNPWLTPSRLEAFPDEVRAALTTLMAWVAEASGMQGLRRERWYVHVLGEAHWYARGRAQVCGLLCDEPGRPDLDAPPIPPIAAVARSWGRALWLDVLWLGESVTDAETVNRLLAERFSFGLMIQRTRLADDRIPECLRWKDAERVAIRLTVRGFQGPDRARDVPAILQSVAATLPNAVACQFSCPTPDVTAMMDAPVSIDREGGDRRVDDIGRRLPGVLWNGRLRNRLRAQAEFLDWLHRLYALATASNAGPPPAAQIIPVVVRVIEDDAFAARGADQIHRQDGGCLDASRRTLHQLIVLNNGSLTGDADSAVLAAFQLACLLRADGAAQQANPAFEENLEDALLLRLAVAQRVRERLGGSDESGESGESGEQVHLPEDVSFGHLGSEGARWNEVPVQEARRRQADALIEAEIDSGFTLSVDCLHPDGLVGDLLTRGLDQQTGNAALEEGWRADAQARYEAASARAGDDALAQQAADDRMAQDLARLESSFHARRQQHLDAATRALKERLSTIRSTDTGPTTT